MNDGLDGTYVCKKMRLVEALALKGLTPFGTMPDRKAPGRTVWLYKSSKLLHDAIEEYYSRIPIK